MDLQAKEETAAELIRQDKKDEAVKLLFELIVSHAEAGNFEKADSLRRKLMDTDPMALSEIINSGEIIDDHKSRGIDQDFKQIWASLFQALTAEEANAFFYALKSVRMLPGKPIIAQGKLNDKLFFVNTGNFDVICHSAVEEMVIKKLGPADICGITSFFDITLATTSVRSATAAGISYLTRRRLQDIDKKHPGLDKKLHDLCKKMVPVSTSKIIQEQAAERRNYKRFPAQGKVGLLILNAQGDPISKQVYAILEDLSLGGAAFSIRSSNRENVRALLGRTARIKLISSHAEDAPKEVRNGRITGIQDQLFNNYAISFQFFKPLSEKVMSRYLKKQD